MRLLYLAWLIAGLCYPATAQVQHGSVGVVYFTQDKIAVAADSRGILTRKDGSKAPPDDSICKIATFGGKVIFVSTGLERSFDYGPLVPGWDNISIARNAYIKIASIKGGISGNLADMAKEWSTQVASRFNTMALMRPDVFKGMLPQAGAFTVAHLGGFDARGNLVLFAMTVSPSTSRTSAEPDTWAVASCPDQNFCALGVVNIVSEFANASSERAKTEVAEWKAPAGSSPRDYDMFKTMRMVELTIRYNQGQDVGGDIDGVQLSHDGSLHWQAQKKNCPEN